MGLFKKLKFHTPTFHMHGEKYKIGAWGRLTLGRNTRLKWRAGWRQHGRYYNSSDHDDYRSGDVVGLLRPSNSARQVYRNNASLEYG